MASAQYTLLDIDSTRNPKQWSPNTLKSRAVLNFKGLPFQTRFINFADVVTVVSTLGVPKNEKGRPFSVPVVITPEGKAIMDSMAIFEYLEKVKPQPSLLSADQKEWVEAFYDEFNRSIGPSMSVVLPLVPTFLDQKASEYFKKSRTEMFGKPLDQLVPDAAEREKIWMQTFEAINKLGDTFPALRKTIPNERPLTYADILLSCYIEWVHCCDATRLQQLLQNVPWANHIYQTVRPYFV